ncbi:phage baseplate assembly protein V [Psychrilyobacter sp.]|uniref:phage baseplate assembly protein V n=1 Tax=Psychrilyobacter sp. TaxID=2586924 RepID=UPI00301AF041
MFRFLRTGKVSSINYKEVSVSVEFDDSPGIISKELKVLSDHTSKEKDYSLPNVGEDVVCVFLPHAPTVGFVLGSYYSGKNLPPDTGEMKYILFPDGTKIKYNMETSVLEVDCVGEVNISSGVVVNIKGQEVNIEADSFNVTASESNFDHKINCADVVADKGSYNDHINNLH